MNEFVKTKEDEEKLLKPLVEELLDCGQLSTDKVEYIAIEVSPGWYECHTRRKTWWWWSEWRPMWDGYPFMGINSLKAALKRKTVPFKGEIISL